MEKYEQKVNKKYHPEYNSKVIRCFNSFIESIMIDDRCTKMRNEIMRNIKLH